MATCDCWTAGCTGACTPTGCAPHQCQNSCQGCGGCTGCSGCSNQCSGCGSGCASSCTGTCKTTCTGTCISGCANACSGNCTVLCNVTCSTSVATEAATRLKLTTLIEAMNIQDVQDILEQEAARRPDLITNLSNLDIDIGIKAKNDDINIVLNNLREIGQTTNSVTTIGNIISRALGREIIDKTLKSYNTQVNLI